MKDADNFQEWAGDYVLFTHITSRVDGAKYPRLLSEKGGRGFPYLVFLDAEGDVLVKVSGSRNVDGFKKDSEKLKSLLALKEKAASGDAGAKFDYLIVRIDLGLISVEEAQKERDSMDLSPAQSKKLDKAFVGLRVAAILAKVRSREAAVDAGKQFAAMLKKGMTPANPDSREWGNFMGYIMLYAEDEGNAGLYEDAFDRFKEQHGSDKRYARNISRMEKKLEALKSDDGTDK